MFTDDPDTQDMVTKEFLHDTTPSGMPPHILELKENTVLLTLRNLAPDVGPVQRHEDTGAPHLRAQHPGTDNADGPALLRPAHHHDVHGRV